MTKKKVVVLISGGCLTGVNSNDPDIEVDLIDRDILRDEGKSESEITAIEDKALAECPHEVF